MTLAEIWKAALDAAKAAAEAENNRLPPEQQRGLDCGFAWVIVKPAKGPLVKYLKSVGVGSTRTYGGGGYEIWYSAFHSIPTQSISVHERACWAAVGVLKANGVNCYASSRLD
jgi:hypothetical protein